ncbi:MAG TPA: cellulase family glycosylhydrolase [Myxococcaceae bacterium]|nr:cellulase family glycosylhydrolase [Myxococcaceae bacterium]
MHRSPHPRRSHPEHAAAWLLAAATLVAACGGNISSLPGEDGGLPADGGGSPDGGARPDGGTPVDGGTVLPALHAEGNELLDPAGHPVQLRGVNRSGTEYACIQGWGIFDGPSDDASLDAIVAWKANAIRIPMNEDCWLAINGAPAAYSGASYQQAIAAFVQRAVAKGLYPILELHWSASGTTAATGQDPMPNRDHSVAFWAEVAGAFRDQPEVILELFNEPYPDSNQDTDAAWTCWLSGGTCSGVSYAAAGMQELVTAVRDAGAGNLVLLGGVQYSNSLSQWLSHVPSDPADNLAAAWHVYNFNACNSASCYDSTVAPVAAGHPVVATEIGEDDCAGTFIDPLMSWLDGHGASYLGWAWDTWGGCLVLIDSYDGTPNGAYGTAYRSHLQSFP